ncbi:hypothetical protein Bca101_047836 [Brassica carinata]
MSYRAQIMFQVLKAEKDFLNSSSPLFHVTISSTVCTRVTGNSFTRHDCALHLRNLSQPAILFPASSSGAQPLLHRRSASSPPGHLSLSAGKLLSLSNSGQLSRWSSQILVVKKNPRERLIEVIGKRGTHKLGIARNSQISDVIVDHE